MRVATNRTLDDRRQHIIDLLTFIHDFNKLDTTLVIQRVQNDQKFLEAAEAVLAAGVGAWRSIEALRDFCVQNMIGEKPPAGITVERGRVSPFSVPFQLLRAIAPNPGNFDPRDLKSLAVAEMFEVGTLAGEDRAWHKLVPQGEAWLVTSVWSRGFPRAPRHTQVWVQDVGSNRILHEGPLWAWIVEALPCFWWLSPNSALEVRFTRQRPDEATEVLMVIEGWRFMLR